MRDSANSIKPIKAAIIDLYNGETNQGIRCVKDILNELDVKYRSVPIEYELFDTRVNNDVPDTGYDLYISSGGPGSPFEGEGSQWEKNYFNLLDSITSHNASTAEEKKHIFFICHSFQLMARYYKFAEVTARNRKSFGIVEVNTTDAGKADPIFSKLPDPFYGADFRSWQVVQPKQNVLDELGASILAIEKERPHVPFERAVMAVRISPEILGTQFHPEADPASMYYHFRQPERKQQVVDEYGEEKYFQMISILDNPDTLLLTRKTVISGFLGNAIETLRPEQIESNVNHLTMPLA